MENELLFLVIQITRSEVSCRRFKKEKYKIIATEKYFLLNLREYSV